MNVVKVRNLEIGTGKPKIIVPIVGITREEILAEATALCHLPLDVVEWRADWFEGSDSARKVQMVLHGLREILGDIPILMTFRTSREGGEKAIDLQDYIDLNLNAARSGLVDLIDVELFTGEEAVRTIIDGAHECGVKVVVSNHDFFRTPDKDEIVRRLVRMQEMGADLPKIALMPQSRNDVLTLLAATEEMAFEKADRPIITMSMADDGIISRLCGEIFGSSMTFGCAAKASAPGQISVHKLANVLEAVHQAL